MLVCQRSDGVEPPGGAAGYQFAAVVNLCSVLPLFNQSNREDQREFDQTLADGDSFNLIHIVPGRERPPSGRPGRRGETVRTTRPRRVAKRVEPAHWTIVSPNAFEKFSNDFRNERNQ